MWCLLVGEERCWWNVGTATTGGVGNLPDQGEPLVEKSGEGMGASRLHAASGPSTRATYVADAKCTLMLRVLQLLPQPQPPSVRGAARCLFRKTCERQRSRVWDATFSRRRVVHTGATLYFLWRCHEKNTGTPSGHTTTWTWSSTSSRSRGSRRRCRHVRCHHVLLLHLRRHLPGHGEVRVRWRLRFQRCVAHTIRPFTTAVTSPMSRRCAAA